MTGRSNPVIIYKSKICFFAQRDLWASNDYMLLVVQFKIFKLYLFYMQVVFSRNIERTRSNKIFSIFIPIVNRLLEKYIIFCLKCVVLYKKQSGNMVDLKYNFYSRSRLGSNIQHLNNSLFIVL